MKNLPQPVENIKAESFLTTFLDSCSDVTIEHRGVFSRNYNEDVVDVEIDSDSSDKINIRLSRDSLFHILPEGLFFAEYKLREAGKKNNSEKFRSELERINKEKKKILSFFQPFDSTYFRLRFELEKELNSIAENRIRILTNELLDVFPINSENNLIRKIIPLIPFASEIRGNKRILKDMLQDVFSPATIEMQNIKRRSSTGIVERIMKIIVNIEKLSSKEFNSLRKDIETFARFFYEWFLPVDLGYELKIKDTKERFILGNSMTLDYNTYLK